jgi:hypothetical protein
MNYEIRAFSQAKTFLQSCALTTSVKEAVFMIPVHPTHGLKILPDATRTPSTPDHHCVFLTMFICNNHAL